MITFPSPLPLCTSFVLQAAQSLALLTRIGENDPITVKTTHNAMIFFPIASFTLSSVVLLRAPQLPAFATVNDPSSRAHRFLTSFHGIPYLNGPNYTVCQALCLRESC